MFLFLFICKLCEDWIITSLKEHVGRGVPYPEEDPDQGPRLHERVGTGESKLKFKQNPHPRHLNRSRESDLSGMATSTTDSEVLSSQSSSERLG